MGGRSREPKEEKIDRYAFVSELSNERLEAYGRYTSAGHQNWDESQTTQTGIPTNTTVFNEKLSDEFRNRFGERPDWDLNLNGGIDRYSRLVKKLKDDGTI
jgi:hypothetical protein